MENITRLGPLGSAPCRRLTGLLTNTKISKAIFVNIEANYRGNLSKNQEIFY
jgi:hypothetical protein